MENIIIRKASGYINGEYTDFSVTDQSISARHEHETKSGDLFKNADGEVFLGTLKICSVKPLTIKDKIKKVFRK